MRFFDFSNMPYLNALKTDHKGAKNSVTLAITFDRAKARIENTIFQLDKSRSKNRVQDLKNRNSPLSRYVI